MSAMPSPIDGLYQPYEPAASAVLFSNRATAMRALGPLKWSAWASAMLLPEFSRTLVVVPVPAGQPARISTPINASESLIAFLITWLPSELSMRIGCSKSLHHQRRFGGNPADAALVVANLHPVAG